MRIHIFTFLLAVACLGCKKNKTLEPSDLGKNYFPLQAGAYVIYEVDSTFYDDFFIPVKVVNAKFLLKEKVQSFYYDNESRLTARIERYVKAYDSLVPYDQMQWQLRNVWAANLLNTSAERLEGNTSYVKLVFPVVLDKTWNANARNAGEEKEFAYTAVDQSESIGGVSLDSVATTEYDDGGTILTKREYYAEKYARNVGLVYRNEINVESQPDPTATAAELQLFYATPILNRVTSGYYYTWTLVSYGTE